MIDEEKLLRAARNSRWAALLSLLVFVALVVASVFSLNTIQRTVREQRVTSRKLAERSRRLEAEIAQKESALAILNQQIPPANRVRPDNVKLRPLPTPGSGPGDIKPMVRAVPKDVRNDQGQSVYDFTLWVEAPPDLREMIAEVKYDFNHPSFQRPTQTSTNAADGFAVHYVGWGALRMVTVTITLKDGTSQIKYFDMVQALGW